MISSDDTANLDVAGNAGFSGSSITLGTVAGDGMNFGSLTFTSAGAVSLAEDSDLRLAGTNTAASLTLHSAGAMTNAATATLTVIGQANLGGESIDLGSHADDTLDFGSLTFSATGTVSIAENSALLLTGSSQAGGALTLTSVDTPALGEDLTVAAGATVLATSGNVLLNGGDDVTLSSGSAVTAPAGSITINGDYGNADPTVPTAIQLLGQLSSLNAIQVNGAAGDDRLTLNPSGSGASAVDLRGPVAMTSTWSSWATCRARSRSWMPAAAAINSRSTVQPIPTP